MKSKFFNIETLIENSLKSYLSSRPASPDNVFFSATSTYRLLNGHTCLLIILYHSNGNSAHLYFSYNKDSSRMSFVSFELFKFSDIRPLAVPFYSLLSSYFYSEFRSHLRTSRSRALDWAFSIFFDCLGTI